MLQQGVTWIHVERPSFDLVGLVLGSLKLTGLLFVIACALGGLLGLALILHRRQHPPPSPLDAISLHLDA